MKCSERVHIMRVLESGIVLRKFLLSEMELDSILVFADGREGKHMTAEVVRWS